MWEFLGPSLWLRCSPSQFSPIFFVSGPPVAPLSCVGVCPEAASFSPPGRLHIHTNTLLPSLTSPKWTHQRALIPIHWWSHWVKLSTTRNKTAALDICFNQQCSRFVCFVLLHQLLCWPSQNVHVVASEYLMPFFVDSCLSRLSRSGGWSDIYMIK